MAATPPNPDQPATPHAAGQVPPDRRRQAVAKLLGSGRSVSDQVIDRFVHQAPNLGIDLDLLAAAWRNPDAADREISQVCLPVLGPGRTVMLFLSGGNGRGPDEIADRAAAVAAAVDLAARARPVHLIQALVEPHEAWAVEAFEAAGLRRIADLLYLSRPLRLGEARRDLVEGGAVRPPGADPWPDGITVRPLQASVADEEALHRALEESYHDTLDCPELGGMRSTEDIVAAHRGVGRYDPALWWLIESQGQAEGCVLLNRCPDQGCVELVYIGLSPAVRGLGLGRSLMHAAVGACSGLERELRCAVDSRNAPALRMYERLGFRETGRRIALVGLVKDLPSRKS